MQSPVSLLRNINISKYMPFGVRLLQLIRFRKRIPVTPQISGGLNNSSTLGFQMFASLAFLWPVTSNSKQKANKKEVLKVESTIKDADNLFENAHYEQCYQLLTSEELDDVEIKWRVARVLYNMSKESKIDTATKKELIITAYEIILSQLEKNWDHFAVQKWYALLLDAKSSNDGIKEHIKQLENVKKHMDLAATLNPSDATTLHMLGEWCYQVAELPWHQRKIAETFFASPPQSSYEDAMEYFLQAETADPRFYSINLLRLGSCYLKLKKDDQAKYYLKLAASYPAKSNDDHQANIEAAELLKKFR